MNCPTNIWCLHSGICFSFHTVISHLSMPHLSKCYQHTREIQKVRAILEYFHCMIDNTAEAWSYCSTGSDGDMLQAWFSCPFVPSEHGVKMVATLDVCTKEKQH
jgi:hypothetical protein